MVKPTVVVFVPVEGVATRRDRFAFHQTLCASSRMPQLEGAGHLHISASKQGQAP
jgi:hypothetical protein